MKSVSEMTIAEAQQALRKCREREHLLTLRILGTIGVVPEMQTQNDYWNVCNDTDNLHLKK